MYNNRTAKTRRPRLELLARREMMAADLSLQNGVLTIEGDDNRENVAFVELSGSQVNVNIWQYQNDGQLGYENQTSHRDETYDIAEVNKILFIGGIDHNNLAVHQATLNSGVSVDHLAIEFHGGDSYDFFHNSSWLPSTAHGYGGTDIFRGGFGRDQMFGGEGNDHLAGSDGNDRLDAGDGLDWLQGGYGDDTLFGRDGSDALDGGGGNDLIYGGAGSDFIFGHMGFEQQESQLLSGSETQFNFALVVDEILFKDNGDLNALDLDAALSTLLGDDYASELESGELSGTQGGDDRIYGESGNDVIYGGGGRDQIFGGSGSDLLLGGSGLDYIYGGDEDDLIRGGSGSDYIDGGSGADFLYGGLGRDRLFGRGGVDFLSGGADEDYLDGGYDGVQDMLHGGSGVDHIVSKYVVVNKPTPYSIPTTTLIDEELVLGEDTEQDVEITLEFYTGTKQK